MAQVEHHPYAKLFPMLGGDELRELAEDIRQHGQRHKIVVDPDGRIIDGRNRAEACRIAGKEPQFETFDGDDGQILDLVISLNINRRHLSESQRAMIAAEVATLRVGRPEEIAPIGAISDSKLKNSKTAVTQTKAAESLNVSRRSVQRAKKVREKATPEVQEAVKAGVVTVSKAAEIAEKPKDEQPAALVEATKPRRSQFDPEELERQSKKNGAPVQVAFDDRPADKAVGALRRHLDDRLKAFPGTERFHKQAKYALGQFNDILVKWREST